MRWARFTAAAGRSGQVHLLLRILPEEGPRPGHRRRARPAGFGELEKYVRAGRADQRPRDGYFTRSGGCCSTIRSCWPGRTSGPAAGTNPGRNLPQGKIDQSGAARRLAHLANVSFSPFHRAEEDYAGMTGFSDFIRPVLYSNCAGERMRSFVDSVHGNVLGDGPPDEMLQVLYQMLNYREAPYGKVAAAGLFRRLRERETRRAVDDLAGTRRKCGRASTSTCRCAGTSH